MKVYSYFVCKVWNGEKECFEVKKIKLANEVVEIASTYKQASNKKFYTNWSTFDNEGYLYKESIGKVDRNIYGTNIIYGIYLMEDNEQKAFSLISEECKKDIEKMQNELKKQMEIYTTICADDIQEL